MTAFASKFLRTPDFFPGRIAGEPFGEAQVSIELAGDRYRLVGLNHLQRASVEQRFPTRLREPGKGDVEIRVFPIAKEEFTTFDVAGWTYWMDFDHQPQRVRMAAVDFLGIVEFDRAAPSETSESAVFVDRVTRAALWTFESESLSIGVLENFLRVVLSYRLLGRGGVMLHSAAVANCDGARVFVGHSGAGKSTLSQLSADAGHQVLSDDINTLVPHRAEGNSFAVDQVPFAGDFGNERLSEGKFPLVGIYRLVQAEKHGLEPLAPSDTLALLLANSPFVNSDEHRMDRLLEVLLRLVASIGGHRLLFRQDAGFWDLLSLGQAELKTPS